MGWLWFFGLVAAVTLIVTGVRLVGEIAFRARSVLVTGRIVGLSPDTRTSTTRATRTEPLLPPSVWAQQH
jgi:hypothetical protein